MPEIQIPGIVVNILQLILAFFGAFAIALWVSMIVWTFRDAKARSRDPFAILLGTLMVVIFGPLGLLLYFLLRPKVTLAELYERSLEEEALLQDLEERPHCAGCSRTVENEWVVCPDCHTQLKRMCLNCNQSLHLRWNICPYCGTGVNQAGLQTHAHAHQPQAPAKQISTGHQPVQLPSPAYEEQAEPESAADRESNTRPVEPVKVIPLPATTEELDSADEFDSAAEEDESEYMPGPA